MKTRELNFTILHLSPYKQNTVPEALYVDGILDICRTNKITGAEIVDSIHNHSTEGERHTFDPHMYYTNNTYNTMYFPETLEEAIKYYDAVKLY